MSLITPSITKPRQYLTFEPRSPKEENDKKLYTFDQSLARIKQAGYFRHPFSREVFLFIADGLEGKLTDEQKEMYDDMLNSYGEWVSAAMERQSDILAVYLNPNPDGLIWKPSQNQYAQNNFHYTQKKEFRIPGKSSTTWINLEEFDDALINFLYGRSFARLPQKMREGGKRARLYLPSKGQIGFIGRVGPFSLGGGDFNDKIFGSGTHIYRASRGVHQVITEPDVA